MGVNLKYGTAGATGGGWSAQPGSMQASFSDLLAILPAYDYQRRAPRTWKDRNRWYSLWSYGCRASGGAEISGLDGGNGSLSMRDLYEPYSCDGEGTQSRNFLRGTCKDSVSAIVANATVQAFVTATDVYAGEGVSLSDGTYYVGVEQLKSTAMYLVAYKPGSPDIAGTTVNTLLPTNVDGTS